MLGEFRAINDQRLFRVPEASRQPVHGERAMSVLGITGKLAD
jgi:hypothetical protein